jgi:pimeloyl-ACP methyl ester carboxylesterase
MTAPVETPNISQLEISGTSIRVMRAGSGAPMLLLPGTSGADGWSPYMAALAAEFDVIVPQHPGFGGAERPEWLERISDLANFYLDFQDRLDLSGVHLVGLSLGGWAAAELATRNTTRLASLTLSAPAGLYLPGVPQFDLFAVNDEQAFTSLFHDKALAEQVRAHVFTPENEDALLHNRVTVARLCWQPRLHDPQLRHWLHRINVPTLLVWGENDPLFPPPYAQEWARLIPGARTVTLSECGHLPQVEKPHAFLAALRDFAGERRIAA